MTASYVCDQCGACCRTKLVDVYDVDLLREARLGEHVRLFREPGLDGEIGYLNCLTDGGCPFLDGEHGCSIYPLRPSVCVLFPAGSEECQEARLLFGIPLLEPTNSDATIP